MIVGEDKLIRNFFIAYERFESWWALVVEKLNFGGEAAGNEVVVNDCKGPGKFFVVAAFQAFGEDAFWPSP